MWVFGIVDTSHSPALGAMKAVPNWTASTLLPIIEDLLAPGTIVHSDQWCTYSQVSSLPNVSSHATVNHSIEFVSSTWAHVAWEAWENSSWCLWKHNKRYNYIL